MPHKTNGLRVTSDSVVYIKLTRTVCVASESVRVGVATDEAKQARKCGSAIRTQSVRHANVKAHTKKKIKIKTIALAAN